jgi:hypothetical protein
MIAAVFSVGNVSGFPNDWGVLALSGWGDKLSDESIEVDRFCETACWER